VPPDRVRIGYNRSFAPFAFEGGGGPAGLAIDVTRAAVAAAGLDAEFVPLTLPVMFDSLLAGEVDLLAGTGAAAGRADQFSFSAPIVATGGAWFPRADIAWPSQAELETGGGAGLRVVTPATGPLAPHIAEAYPQLTLATCGDYADALAQVAAGDADAAALNAHVGRDLIAGDVRFAPPGATFIQINLVVAARHGDPDGWLARLNPHIPPLDPGI
jgi:ABC-type amino acid transport substrate-binding protein